MARPFKLPDLGEGIHEGEVIAVLVSEGDHVTEGQPILEVETDKAAVQIPCPFSGIVQKISVKPNEMVKVGSVMMTFGEEGAAKPETRPAPAEASAMDGHLGQSKADVESSIVAKAGGQMTVVDNGLSSSLGSRAAATGTGEAANAEAKSAHPEGPVPASPATRRVARELGVDLRLVTGSGPAGLVTASDVRAFAASAETPSGVEASAETSGAVPPSGVRA
ncbi:MAG TPA: biotin/lipoyl-containing protein, partial [Chloroflexota bacterium]|nr:biotin/lipoyl-containing protein [Chloroflexota bacterium]